MMLTLAVVALFAATAWGGASLRPHPRLFVSGLEDFAAFNARAAKDPQWTGYRKLLLDDADRVLGLKNVVSVDDGPQVVEGQARIVQTSFGNEASSVALDLTETFAGQAKKVGRRLELNKRTGALSVDDSLRGVRSGARVEWKILTEAEAAEIAGAEAVLRSGAHHLRVTCAVPAKGVAWKFDDLSAPVNSWDAPNKDLKRLSFVMQAPKDGVVNLSVRLTPID